MSWISFLKRNWMNIPITIYFNFKVFDLKQAIKLPILISNNSVIEEIHRGNIVIPNNAKMFSVKIGIEGVPGVSPVCKSYIYLSKNARLHFKGNASLSRGISIRCLGDIHFGENFYCNCGVTIICSKEIVFGNGCLLGWNIHLRDCDGHNIMNNGKIINPNKTINVGNHVWIGQDVKILKGCSIPDECVVAMNSCVTKQFDEKNIIIGGYPAKILKRNIKWEV